MRLVEGRTEQEGRVEICTANTWGTICHHGWDTIDARVVCLQLGYTVAGSYYYTLERAESLTHIISAGAVARRSAFYGQGSGPFKLSFVACTGNERRLGDCPSGSLSHRYSSSRCNSHSYDVGVSCMLKTGNSRCM